VVDTIIVKYGWLRLFHSLPAWSIKVTTLHQWRMKVQTKKKKKSFINFFMFITTHPKNSLLPLL